jgi:hypothetical protein
MRLHVTRRPNGLHLLTRYPPIIAKLGKTDQDEVFAKPGDPIAYNNVCQFFVDQIWGFDLQPFETRKVSLIAGTENLQSLLDERKELLARNTLLRTRPDCINAEKAAEWYRGAGGEERDTFLRKIGILQ